MTLEVLRGPYKPVIRKFLCEHIGEHLPLSLRHGLKQAERLRLSESWVEGVFPDSKESIEKLGVQADHHFQWPNTLRQRGLSSVVVRGFDSYVEVREIHTLDRFPFLSVWTQELEEF